MNLENLVWLMVKKMNCIEKTKMICCGLSVAQSYALNEIGIRQKVNLIDLADALSLDKSTMSRTINSLVLEGYVNRVSDTENRKYVILSLTDKGIEKYTAISEIIKHYCNQLFENIPSEKHEQIKESLELIYKSIEKSEGCL